MKKQDVKYLQDEFTNLFDSNPQQQRKKDKNAIHLNNRQQQPHQSNSATFKQLDCPQSQNQEDFLDQIDEVLNHGEEGQTQPSRREVMLNYKINQLKIKCKNLKNANTILRQKINEIQQPKSQVKSQSSLEENQSDLTVIQHDFIELQEELSNYKYQLSNYQKTMSQKIRQKDLQIQSLRRQLNQYKNERMSLEALEQQLAEKDRIIALLERKNQDLLLQIEEQKQKSNLRDGRRHDSYFDDKISNQMQNLIDKLLKQLKFEKKTTAKQLTEIKRLNAQLVQMEGVLKQKNKQIYELEFSLIKANKTQQQKKDQTLSFRQKQRTFQKSQYYESVSGFQPEDLSPYIPQRSQRGNNLMSPKRPQQYQLQNKNRSIQSNRSYDKNQMSAERQGVARVGVNVLSKSLTFTLMDLLNKEFKIRQAQKQIIASRILDLYSRKIMQENYQNLIPEQIQIYNFSSQNPTQIKVRANLMASKGDRQQASQSELLYNMSFILDTLLNQVQVVDAFVQNCLDLNVNEYVSQLQLKSSKQQKYKFLQQLSHNIESYYINN